VAPQPTEARPVNVMIVGVGGQGVILVSKVLAVLAQQRGFEVKQSEVHGMAKRGGTVFSHVRYGPKVWSPTIARGEADILVALEWAEALRWLPWLKAGGALVCDTKRIVPPFACLNRRPGAVVRYPQQGPAEVRDHVAEAFAMDATRMATGLGNERTANVVLLGAVAATLDFAPEEWETALRHLVPPKTVNVNLQAFRAGLAWALAARDGTGEVADDAAAADPAGAAPAPRGAASTEAGVRLEITRDWCKSCDICVKLCPERCLRLDDERIVELTDPARCTGCRLCEWLCPDFAIRVLLAPQTEGTVA
jgi:indolepyruvate ferredoxin oxidoreductase beta subunit